LYNKLSAKDGMKKVVNYFIKQRMMNNGFTLIELVVVVSVLSIIAATVLPRLNLDGFRQTGFAQQAMSAIRYGQKQAIGSGCDVNVSIAVGGCTIQWNGTPGGIGCLGGGTSIINPASVLNDFCDSSSPESSADLPTTIRFDNIGRPTATAGDLSLSLGSRTITIEPETGFAHE
jgi:prepilin-type N-terminal cleavage/methylation domain-containing protein